MTRFARLAEKNGSTETVWRSCVDDRFNGQFKGEIDQDRIAHWLLFVTSEWECWFQMKDGKCEYKENMPLGDVMFVFYRR